MRHLTLLIAIALVGCAPSGPDASADLLTEYDAALTEARGVLGAYAADVTTAADVAAVGALQIAYVEDMRHAMGDVRHVLEDIDGCEHEGMGTSSVIDAMSSATGVEDALDALQEAHAGHTDVSECLDEATAHEGLVADDLDAMAEHHDDWDGEMRCGMHDDDMMGHEG
ncbi:MAG TPA: hypothetical protein ENK18_14355 [Deltaproteobacteria bacterium]|nr:hypothetical protein [Deltaproteobacteria bacterium]